MTAAAHLTWLSDNPDGTTTAMCKACNWEGTRDVSNRAQAQQEAAVHRAKMAGETGNCVAAGRLVDAEHEGCELAVCPACGLTIEVNVDLLSVPVWRYADHDAIDPSLAGWQETLAALEAGGLEAVRRLNARAKEQARLRRLSAEYRGGRSA